SSWHDSSNREPTTYLGYPIWHTQAQFNLFLLSLETKLGKHVQILQGRNLSILGRAQFENSLLLACLWHVLGVNCSPKQMAKGMRKPHTLIFLPT
ncbi:hypothetical protein BC943DRAFT_277132, partial [Umbelopsis sp. AD052]